MQAKFDIKSIMIVTGHGADQIMLVTDLPEGVFPFEGDMCLNFSVAPGAGAEYVRKHFPGSGVEIINRGKTDLDFGRKSG